MSPTATVVDKGSLGNQSVGALGKTTSGKRLKIREYPEFESLEQERLYRKQHLAAAFRVFADRGFDEGVAGHISVRDPILTDHFCMRLGPCTECESQWLKLLIIDICIHRAESAVEAFRDDLRLGSHPCQ